MANNSLTIHTNRFFGSFLKSPIQMGWLSIINSVRNISRLGTFKVTAPSHTAVDFQEKNCQRRTQLCQFPFILYIQLLATALLTNLESFSMAQ
jgi:hypothetical protein